MQEEVPEEEQQTTPRPDRTASPLGEGVEELLAAELTEVAQRAGDPVLEVGASPLPIPDVPEPIGVGMDPDPIVREPEPVGVGMDPDPFSRGDSEGRPEVGEGMGAGSERVGVNPIPTPYPRQDEAGSVGEEVAVAGAEMEGRFEFAPSFQFQVDEVSANPVPLPDVPEPSEMPVGAEVMNNPIPLPEPEPSELLLGSEDVSDIPIPAKIDSFTDSLSSTQFEMEEVSDIPLADPGMEGGFGEVGALPIPFPDEIGLIPENDLDPGMEEEPFEDLLE